ncbi:presenilin-like protein At1g08700 isoform X2 [Zingiber officinale]|uniref:presenilin-like protein At1g08700 isoform X2 n=1 Tax=Zingiber officinale TaxID=94328 RepID=UPI001C4CAAD0|nr:presenilin-like protein At1g08700 isoform X2 [Zingiber officinale]
MEQSILDSLGVEIIGVMSPVSICMLLVVLLVSTLSPSSISSFESSAASATTAATLVYAESPSDPPARRFVGALLNAAAFVALVAVVTTLLVVLYYYRFTGFLRNYVRFSAFFVIASMGGSILLTVLRALSLPLDAVTAMILLLNLSAIGVPAVLSAAVPILLRQAYLVALAVIVAAWFSRLPEWTTWTLLVALALYDLAAVLCPRGPLRVLVELASSREEELPALVYESRPAGSSVSHAMAAFGSVELQPVETTTPNPTISTQNPDPGPRIIEVHRNEEETSPLMSNEPNNSDTGNVHQPYIATMRGRDVESNQDPSSSSSLMPTSESEEFDTSRGIRLGLGDFVFYSVLVGRAAMYDLMTVYACYLAIIAGLACTLILLSICRHALPALPISIALGVGFYFLTRLLLEPFVVGASTNLWLN